jgi:hypothetical protein
LLIKRRVLYKENNREGEEEGKEEDKEKGRGERGEK